MTTCNETPTQGSRILMRPFKARRNIRHLDSLPCLILRPLGRAFFVCNACNFLNIYGTLCPWCLGACTLDPYSQAGSSRKLRRRVTSPSLLSDMQKASLKKREICMPVLCKGSSSITPSTLLSSELADEMPTNMSSGDNTPPIKLGDLRRRRREGVCYASETIWARMSQNLNLECRNDLVALVDDQGNGDNPEQQPDGCVSAHPISIESTRDSDTVLYTKTDPIMPEITCSSRPSLRRKHRMHVLRQRSSCSLPRSTSSSASTIRPNRPQSDLSSQSPSSSTRKVRPNSPLLRTTADYVPLGDLKRPFYTAIRKNMSPPRTQDSALPILDSNAFQAAVFDRISRSLDLPLSPVTGRSSSPTPTHILSRRSTGFSISGMMELRMDLGRGRSMEGAESVYKFVYPKRSSTMSGRVKSLGKGIKDMFSKPASKQATA